MSYNVKKIYFAVFIIGMIGIVVYRANDLQGLQIVSSIPASVSNETIKIETESIKGDPVNEITRIEHNSELVTEETNTYDELVTIEDEESRKVAEEFIRLYHKRMPDYDYIGAVKEYVSYSLFSSLNENKERQLWDREYQEISEVQIIPTADKKTEDYVTWCVVVKGVYKSLDGTVTNENSQDTYIVTMERNDENKWKVMNSWRNVRN